MGLMSKLMRNAGKAKDLAEKNADKIAGGVNKATDYVDGKTKGKYKDKLDKVDKAAQDFADKNDGTGSGGGPTTPPTQT